MGAVDLKVLQKAADVIASAEALLICAGAGMGVDSGLPDFRGVDGFWRAYPAFAALNLRFEELACPIWFAEDPALAWGFYGHRFNLYQATRPHIGFDLLREWAASKPGGYFVFTSNVDGHFEKAGFAPERIVECHGSLHHWQCAWPCCLDIWEAEATPIAIDETTMRAQSPFPSCPRCGEVARPNVLMFDDWNWSAGRSISQERRLEAWLGEIHRHRTRLAIIECGAGRAIPTVRWFSDREGSAPHATLIRINPHDVRVPSGGISLPLGAKDALTQIDALLRG